MFGSTKRRGNYAYTVTRVKAKKSLLIKEEEYNKMLMMAVPEISRYMSESGYQKEMSELANRLEGIDLVEYAAYLNMSRVFTNILDMSNGDLHTMIYAYLEKWNIWNVKVIVRGKSFGLDEKQIREDFVPAGSLKEAQLEKLLALPTIEEVLTEYGRMDAVSIPDDVKSSYDNTGSLSGIDDFLDKFRYSRILESIVPDSKPKAAVLEYVRREIDLVNFSTIMKLKAEGIYGDEVMQYIVPNGKQLDKKKAIQLANIQSLSAVSGEISQFDFYEDISSIMEASEVSIREIESALNRYKMKIAKEFSHMNPLSVAPVIDYMINKEREISNILAIARGRQSGIPAEKIKELLVI